MTPYDLTPPQERPRERPRPLVDGFGRTVRYLRISVTDRCDLRCVYCMSEHMTFLPKAQVLTLEELDRIASAFVATGTRKLRLTGGEPLVRKGLMTLVRRLARHLESGALDELSMELTLVDWEADTFATIGIEGNETADVALLVDRIFTRLLGCDDADYTPIASI